MIKRKHLLIIIFLVLIILFLFVFCSLINKHDVINKIIKKEENTYSYLINYPYFNNDRVDNYVDNYLNERINTIILDNGDLFIDYDYNIKDNNIFIKFYEYVTKLNTIKENIYEINYDYELDHIIKKRVFEEDNYDILNYTKSNKMVAFTFDDGPSYNTIKIVNTLVKYDSKATFFLVGNQIEKYAKTMDVLVKNGMDIGNHTYSHKELTKLRDKEILKEIDLTNEVIYNKTGIKPMFLRPSYGAMNKRIKKLSTMPIIIWNIDTLDWKYHNSNKIKDKILKYVSDGDIILMHDTYVATLNAVEMVIPELKKQGYKIVSVSELFKYKGVKPKLGIGYGYVGGRNE
ncbi:polysaccharide deacetylase [Clostridium sp. CAG:762]|nr:polysaccharide deacetylase [Clostridium sp. CAG:762]